MLMPQELKKNDFTRAMRGYTPAEVDAYVEYVCEKYELLYRENDELARKLAAAMGALNEMKAREAKILALDAEVKRVSAKILTDAEAQAEKILADAKAQADASLAETEVLLRQENSRLAALRQSVLDLRDDLYARYSAQIDAIEEMVNASFDESVPANPETPEEAMAEDSALTAEDPEKTPADDTADDADFRAYIPPVAAADAKAEPAHETAAPDEDADEDADEDQIDLFDIFDKETDAAAEKEPEADPEDSLPWEEDEAEPAENDEDGSADADETDVPDDESVRLFEELPEFPDDALFYAALNKAEPVSDPIPDAEVEAADETAGTAAEDVEIDFDADVDVDADVDADADTDETDEQSLPDTDSAENEDDELLRQLQEAFHVEFDNFKASKPETEEFTAIPHPDDLPPPEEEKRPSFFDLFKPRDN